MRFGVVLTTAQPQGLSHEQVFDQSIEQARLAEELGFESAWLLEHHFTRYGLCPSPLVMAGYILGATTRLRVGTAVCVVPLDHPIRLAEQVALVDQLSKGRLYFGFGRGAFLRDFEAFGVDVSQNHLMVPEWVDIMRRAWTEETVDADGQFVTFDAVPVFPRPYTRPHPPLYSAAQNPGSVEWAARNAIPLLFAHRMELESKLSVLEMYGRAAEAAGHDPNRIDHVLTCVAVVADSRREAMDRIRARLDWWEEAGARDTGLWDADRVPPANYSFLFRNARTSAITREMFDKVLDATFRLNPIGTEQDCVERLEEVVEQTGIRHVVCGFEGSEDDAQTLESMRRFAANVMPVVQAPVGVGAVGAAVR
jgi:alkanal monooxygenase alpha chain